MQDGSRQMQVQYQSGYDLRGNQLGGKKQKLEVRCSWWSDVLGQALLTWCVGWPSG
jgi:hypothetical protein